jgi:1-acyl-sn-glycerol-3-phosphate acyltransferase
MESQLRYLPAIPARHSRLGDALIYWALVRYAIWSYFDKVWLRVEGPLPHPADGPLIFYLNHPSWWDGYMASVISRVALRGRFQGYLMMEERELRRYRFFSWAGCFSVNRQDHRSAARSVAYIGRLLAERRDRALAIFPQGEITPNDRRPLITYPGIAHIARRPAARCCCRWRCATSSAARSAPRCSSGRGRPTIPRPPPTRAR